MTMMEVGGRMTTHFAPVMASFAKWKTFHTYATTLSQGNRMRYSGTLRGSVHIYSSNPTESILRCDDTYVSQYFGVIRMMYFLPSSFREFVLDHYPVLRSNVAYRRLMGRLMCSPRRDSKSNGVLLDYRAVAVDMGLSHKTVEGGHAKTEAFLIEFNKDVFCSNTPFWSKKDFRNNLCRVAQHTFPTDLSSALYEALRNPLQINSDVDFVTGRTFNRSNRSIARQKQGERPRQTEELVVQSTMLDYLNSLPSNSFAIRNDDAGNAFDYAATKASEQSRNYHLRVLRMLCVNPQPRYGLSQKNNTVRLFGRGVSLQTLSTDLRRLLYPRWIDIDLKQAQLAIVAKLWNIHRIGDFLRSGGSIWDELLGAIGVRSADRGYQEAKSLCKEALYATIFGASKTTIRSDYVRPLRQLGLEFAGRILDHWVFQEVQRAHKNQSKAARDSGHVRTCFDQLIPVSTAADARSALAQQAQALELRLIYPIYQLARNTSEFSIMLHQHDGVSLKFSRREASWLKRIQKAVRDEAESLGIPTWLEVKQDDSDREIAA